MEAIQLEVAKLEVAIADMEEEMKKLQREVAQMKIKHQTLKSAAEYIKRLDIPEVPLPAKEEEKVSSSESKKSTKEETSTTYVEDERAAQPSPAKEKQPQKYYVIFNGSNAGIYKDWSIASIWCTGKPGIIHKSYKTMAEAKEAFDQSTFNAKLESYKEAIHEGKPTERKDRFVPLGRIPKPARGVRIDTPEELKAKQFSQESYMACLDILRNYKNGDQAKHYYPTFRVNVGYKMVFLEEADPLTTFQFFQGGILDTIYFTTLRLFQHFPANIKAAVTNYLRRTSPDRTSFLKMFTTVPEWKEGKLLQGPIMIGFIGASSGELPPLDFYKDDPATEELQYFIDSYLYVTIKAQEMSGRLLYSAPSILILTLAKNPKYSEQQEAMAQKLIQNKFPFSKEIQRELCFDLSYNYRAAHSCAHCKMDKGQKKAQEDSSSPSDEENILREYKTGRVTKSIPGLNSPFDGEDKAAGLKSCKGDKGKKNEGLVPEVTHPSAHIGTPAISLNGKIQFQTDLVTNSIPGLKCPLDCKDKAGVKSSKKEKDKKRERVVSIEIERWIKHYCNRHRILLVGEGDFSFSACLAVSFGSASNMIATSMDCKVYLRTNYEKAALNMEELEKRGCKVMNEIDATIMAEHELLGHLKFDRIVYNFPYAGNIKRETRSQQLRLHKMLVKEFLKNAKEMINENGEIHISHKDNNFHNEWNLESLASSHKLKLIEAAQFDCNDYPGYHPKYGFGGDKNFNCDPSKTYKFGHKRVRN